MSGAGLVKIPDELDYKGIVLMGKLIRPEGIERVQRELQVTHDDVMIISYPRSGNTWLGEALYLLHTDGDFHTANTEDTYDRILLAEFERFVEGAPPSNVARIVERQKQGLGTVIKSHLQARFLHRQITEEGAKVVHVMRNPKDLLVSYYHFYCNSTVLHFNHSFDEFFALWRARRLVYGDPVDFNLGYWSLRHLPNVLIVTYEDAKRDLRATLKKMAAFINRTPSDELLDKIEKHVSLENMQVTSTTNASNNPTIRGGFIREGRVGGWRGMMSEAQSEEMERVYAERLREAGLKYQYHE